MPAPSVSARSALTRAATYVALAMFVYALVVCAWQCDDAYITFRTVRNFWSGDGLTWNPDERVQAYTHPLWMLLSLLAYGVAGEPFFSMTIVAIVLTLATVIALRQLCQSSLHFAASLVVLTASLAFIDFSVCGLENPLLNLLLVASVMVTGADSTPRGECLRASCLAGVFLTRPDAILLVAPLWLVQAWQRRALFWPMLLGLSPIVAWELFSLVYYGALVPNTAIAKLNVDIPAWRLTLEGIEYLRGSLARDPITLTTIALATAYAAIKGHARERLLAAGIGLYLLYVVRIGGDFMNGRFLGAPLIVALCAANRRAGERALLPAALGVLALGYALAWPRSPLRSTLAFGADYQLEKLSDERAYYYPGMGLLPVLVRMPELRERHLPIPWVRHSAMGLDFARGKQRVTVAIEVGVLGYYAGRKSVIDLPALADPLLARMKFHPSAEGFRVGHFKRELPEGYLSSRVLGSNLIERRDLHEAYDAILLATRGPYFSLPRWRAIWRLHSGYFAAAFER
jgi:arabinofuranosyltransferase